MRRRPLLKSDFLAACVIGAAAVALPRAAYASTDLALVVAYLAARDGSKAYEAKSPQDTTRCMGAWAAVGAVAIQKPKEMAAVSSDLTVSTADALFQHWWQRAAVAYAALGAKGGPQFQSDLNREMNLYFLLAGHRDMKEVLQKAGTCYRPPGERLVHDRNVTLRAYLASLERRPRQQQVQRKPASKVKKYLFAMVGVGGICSKDDVITAARKGAEEACRKQGGQPRKTTIIDWNEQGEFQGILRRDFCYNATAEAECVVGR